MRRIALELALAFSIGTFVLSYQWYRMIAGFFAPLLGNDSAVVTTAPLYYGIEVSRWHLDATFIATLICTLFAFLCLRIVRSTASLPLRIGAGLALAGLGVLGIQSTRTLWDSIWFGLRTWINLLGVPGFAVLAFALCASLVRFWNIARKAIVVLLLARLPADAAICGLALHRRLDTSAWSDYGIPSSDDAAARPRYRIVLAVFDRWSYLTTFEARPVGLALPALDRLSAGSIGATRAFPPGRYTSQSIPGLLSGRPIRSALSWGSRHRFFATSCGAEAAAPWNPADTLFGDLKAARRQSSIAGWYMPYCRLFGSMVEQCHSYPGTGSYFGRFSNLSAAEAWRWVVAPFVNRDVSRTVQYAARNLRDLAARAGELAADPRLDFVLLHYPAPHPPWLYDQATGQISAQNGSTPRYLDNLALVDHLLGELQESISRSVTAERTILVVTSDHSNFEAIEVDLPLDRRVPFFIRYPSREPAPYQLERPFNTVLLRDLIAALLSSDEPMNGPGIEHWLDEREVRSSAATACVQSEEFVAP